MSNDIVCEGIYVKCNPTSAPATCIHQDWEHSIGVPNNAPQGREECKPHVHTCEQMRNKKKDMQDGSALKNDPPRLQNDKSVVLVACTQNDMHFNKHPRNHEMTKKRLFWQPACSQNGYELKFAFDVLRADKEVVMTAAASKPESLKLVLASFNQDKDCLIQAGLWDNDYFDKVSHEESKKIVLSAKVSLAARSSTHTARFTVELKRHLFIADNSFVVHLPNNFNEGKCNPELTNKDWPCQGTDLSCQISAERKSGVPQADCYWRC